MLERAAKSEGHGRNPNPNLDDFMKLTEAERENLGWGRGHYSKASASMATSASMASNAKPNVNGEGATLLESSSSPQVPTAPG